MQIDVVNIGNSKGVRIPAYILAKLENPSAFNIDFDDVSIKLTPPKEARDGWEKAFQKDKRKSQNYFESIESDFDVEDWKW